MPIKLLKRYTGGVTREELANTVEIGIGINLTQSEDGLPALAAAGAGLVKDLGSGTTFTPNFTDTHICMMTLTGANCTLNNPVGAQNGGSYILIFKTSVANAKITWGSQYKFAGGIKPSISAASGSVDILTCVCDGTNLYGVLASDFK